jgi:hypothetical protein
MYFWIVLNYIWMRLEVSGIEGFVIKGKTWGRDHMLELTNITLSHSRL